MQVHLETHLSFLACHFKYFKLIDNGITSIWYYILSHMDALHIAFTLKNVL